MLSLQHTNSNQEQNLGSSISEYDLNSQDELQVMEELNDSLSEYHSLPDIPNSLSYNAQSDTVAASASPGFLGIDFDGEDDDWFDKEFSSKCTNSHHGHNSETRLDQIPLDLLPSAPLLRPQAIHQAINFSPLWLNSPPSSVLSSNKTPVPSYKQGQLPTISYPFEPSILTQSSCARSSCMSVTSNNSSITPHTEHAYTTSTINVTSPAVVLQNQDVFRPSEEISCGEVHNEEPADSSVLLSFVVPHSSDERSNRNAARSSSHAVQPGLISPLILHGSSLTPDSRFSADIHTSNHTKESRTQQLGRLLTPVKIYTTHSLLYHTSESLPLGTSIPSPPDTSLSIGGPSLFSPSPTESSTTFSLHSHNSESDSGYLISSTYPSSIESHDSRHMKKSPRSFLPHSESSASTPSPNSTKKLAPSMTTGMSYNQVNEEMDEVLDFDNFQVPECYNDFVFAETDNVGSGVVKRSISQSDRRPWTRSRTSLQHVKSLDLGCPSKIPSLFGLSKLKSREAPQKIPMSSRDSLDSQGKKSIFCRDPVDPVVKKPVPSRSRSLQLVNNVDVSRQNATQNVYPQYGMETEDDDEEEELSRWFDIADDVIARSHQSILERNRAFVRDLKLPELGNGHTPSNSSNAPASIRDSCESEGYVYGPTTSNVLEGFSKESPKVRLHSRIGFRQTNRSKSSTHGHSSPVNESKSSKAQNAISSLYQSLRSKKQSTQTAKPFGLSPNSIPSGSESSHYSTSSSSTSSPSPITHSPHSILLDHGDRSQPPKRSVSQSRIRSSNNSIRAGSIHQGSGNSYTLESSKNLQHALNNPRHHPNPTDPYSHLIHPCRPSKNRHAFKYSQSSLGLDLNC
ncbi:uncharacterized protein MELLADRAFT_64245 [Melampsora larici-populina 98AG31]|uniref:Uncharacterized protein n=1 Tax=Melampsora larici-populina (strain 98AG31 / pathotype 3-4-7) TaxID=747676 RepID=F4RQQ7_MELLP|nr:uncharacterized protein MELLADRAFT_64245 [Melampsora larici-populina 98AG31]EGG05278.1 hypothetical protein MELLADRAFT_64245 [Melampsora larici-populina 98AG31]